MTSPMEWRPVADPRLSEVYQVSEYGEIRRISTRGGTPTLKVLVGGLDKDGYRHFTLMHRSKRVYLRAHRAVCEAFNGPPPEDKPFVLHFDGDVTNNHYTNLRWGDGSENQHDSIRHGTHRESSKTDCVNGHPLAGDNLYVDRDGYRHCRVCRRVSWNAMHARKKGGVGD